MCTASCQPDVTARRHHDTLTQRSTSIYTHTHKHLQSALQGKRYYLEIERLFHPGPWKQTLRHHRNRSSQYVELAAGDHSECMRESVFHIKEKSTKTTHPALDGTLLGPSPRGMVQEAGVSVCVVRVSDVLLWIFSVQRLLVLKQSNIPHAEEEKKTRRFRAQAQRVDTLIQTCHRVQSFGQNHAFGW